MSIHKSLKYNNAYENNDLMIKMIFASVSLTLAIYWITIMQVSIDIGARQMGYFASHNESQHF